ncbi:MAG: type II toxin-antitoxin system Phd/YefM family antitoxin [Gemmatimonadota bacterium]|nr:type II toxin-antitoxin system Phd/YefM family antitoxin [Gemmatimonadota bacterium]
MKTLTALTLRKKLGATLDEVAQAGVPILVTRGNRPLAVLISPEEYQALTAGRTERLTHAATRVAEWRREYLGGKSQFDPVELVRKGRDRR